MFSRVRFISYVAFTIIAFATIGRAPRLINLRPQDLPAITSALTPAGEP